MATSIEEIGSGLGTGIGGLLHGILTPASDFLGQTTETSQSTNAPVTAGKTNTTMYVIIGVVVLVVVIVAVMLLKKKD